MSYFQKFYNALAMYLTALAAGGKSPDFCMEVLLSAQELSRSCIAYDANIGDYVREFVRWHELGVEELRKDRTPSWVKFTFDSELYK